MTDTLAQAKTTSLVTIEAIRVAATTLEGVALRTPLVSFGPPSDRRYLKAESLQPIGAFKLRGAYVAVASLPPDVRARGVITYSSGNHAQGVARAARLLGVAAVIVMPSDAPRIKRERVEADGAEVVIVGTASDERQRVAEAMAAERSLAVIPPFDDDRIIAGQGTVGLEIAEDVADLAVILVPVGGGGLASGIAIAVKSARPDVRVVGVQVEACAPYPESLRSGRPVPVSSALTIADGIAVKHPGELTLSIVRDLLDDVVTVTDEEISKAIVLSLERAKLLVEGAGAASLAALLAGRVGGDGAVAVLLSGGNIDPSLLITVMRHGLTLAGRYLVVRTRISDRPGELVKLLSRIAEERVNLVSVEHHREGIQLSVAETEVELTLSTRDEAHALGLLDAMQRWGYPVERLR
jgi:threonine dehydratase